MKFDVICIDNSNTNLILHKKYKAKYRGLTHILY